MPVQDAKLNHGPMHTNSNRIAAIDVFGDERNIFEVTLFPINHSFRIDQTKKPCYIKMRPTWPIESWVPKKVADYPLDEVDGRTYLENWCTEELDLKLHKKLMLVAWDWASVKPKLQNWLGSSYHEIVHDTVRDVNSMMNFLRDRMSAWGEDLGVRHDAFTNTLKAFNVERLDKTTVGNCRALAELYMKMCRNPFLTFDN